MALLGSYSVLTKNPGRAFGGSTVADTRANSNKSGAVRGMFFNPSVSRLSGTPNGVRPPYSWLIPYTAGGLSSKSQVTGSGAVTSAGLEGGLGGAAALTGSGDLTLANVLYVIVASAAVTGDGSLTATPFATLAGEGTLDGSADLAATIGAAIGGSADLTGSGDLIGAISAALSGAADLTGSGDFVASITGAITSTASLTGSATLSGDILGVWSMVAGLSGSADLVGSVQALASCIADLTGSGDLTGTPSALGNMEADITSSGDVLSTSNVASAIWGAVATAFNEPGTMGNKLNSSASAGDPWTTALPGSYPAGSAGYILSNTVNALLDGEVESSVSVQEALRALLAALTGKASGGGGPTITFRNPEDTTDRVTMTVDESGNRSNVTLSL